MVTDNAIAKQVVDSAIRVHCAFGPGLLESVYEMALAAELRKRGIASRKQVGVPVVYEDERLDLGFRLDLLVAERVIVEVKSVEALADVHFKQVLTYLKLSDRQLGLLINFNAPTLTGNIRRIVNNFRDE